MPMYDYECSVCKAKVELLLRINDPPPEACEECGAEASLRRTISTKTSFQLKGGGWYKDLYSTPGSTERR